MRSCGRLLAGVFLVASAVGIFVPIAALEAADDFTPQPADGPIARTAPLIFALTDPCTGQYYCGVNGEKLPARWYYPHCGDPGADCGTETWYVNDLPSNIATYKIDPPVTTGAGIVTITLTVADNAPVGTYPFSFGANCTGTWICNPGYVSLLVVKPKISLSRQDLLTIEATGVPKRTSNASFSYSAAGDGQIADIEMADGVNPEDNPNSATLINPDGLGPPTPGGLATMTAEYKVAKKKAKSTFKVPTFGMSCYYTTSEDEWGTPPDNCRSVKIGGVTYSGTVKNPNGLKGTYCKSFIAEIKLQGSAALSDGTYVQYDPGTGQITTRKKITGADGSAVVADKTVARDRAIIPTGGVHVDIDRIGDNLLANDTGGKIVGYRIDWYRGIGPTVCSNFQNIISVSACAPGNATCPSKQIK